MWNTDGTPGNTDWQVGTNLSSPGFSIPTHTSYAASRDNVCQCNLISDIFISDTITLSTNTGIYVSFDSYLPNPYNLVSTGDVVVKEPGDINWVTVASVGSLASWQSLVYSLDAAIAGFGNDIVIGFRHSDGGTQAALWAIDNVHVYMQLQYDLGVYSWGSPTSGCLTDAENIEVVVKNYGLNSVSSFDIYYTLNGVNSATQTVTQSIAPGATYNYIFPVPVNLAVEVANEFNATVNVTGYPVTSNSSFTSPIIVKRYAELPIPYTESFTQNDSYYWEVNSASDANSMMTSGSVVMYGTSNPGWVGGLTSTTANNAWVDNTTFQSVVSLRCNGNMVPQNSVNLELVFDLRQETQLALKYSWFAVFVDGTQIADIDGNMNFNPATQNGDPWTQKTYNLSAYNNNNFLVELKACTHHPADKVFIDNLTIQPRNEADAGVVELLAPMSDCGLSSVSDITVVIKNYGVEPISNIPVYYQIDGGTAILAGYFPSTILPGMVSLPYTFNSKPTSGLEIVGTHQFNIYTQLTNDIYFPGNDALLVEVINQPVVSTFPYEQDFESESYWSTSGTASSWELGVPNSGVQITPNTSGQNSWITNLDGNYNNNEYSYVTSHCFDFTTLSDPYFEMDIWYHTDEGYDGAQLQATIDNGQSWDVVGSIPLTPNGDNWYVLPVDALGAGSEGWTGNSGGWVTAHYSLLPYAGESQVRFRVVFASDLDNDLNGVPQNYDGFAFDNVLIRDPQALNDLKAVEWLSPLTGYNLTSTEQVKIRVENLGSNDVSTFTAQYSINNGATYSAPETFNITISSGATQEITFSTPANLFVWGTYQCKAIVQLLLDENAANDITSATVVSLPTIDSFPYVENFQNSDHWWTAGGSNSSWEWGKPMNISIPSLTPNDSAWVTNLDGNYNDNEFSWVESPNFDLSSLIQPAISMRIAYNAESGADGSCLQYSEAGGPWTTIGVLGVYPNPENWYINYVDGLAGEPGWTDVSLGWKTATQDLSMLFGMSSVKLRVLFGSDGSDNNEGMGFDDIVIYESAPHDLALSQWQSQDIACGLSSAEYITVRIDNLGFFTEDNYSVTYNIDYYGTIVSVTENVTTPIAPGDFLIYTFIAAGDFSVPGFYNCSASVSVADDNNPGNNSVSKDLLSSPLVSSFPYMEGFEGSNGNWFESGTNSSWDLGAPTGTVINSAGAGLNSWVTNLNGSYSELEYSYVESPCFNFTTMTNPTIQFKYISNTETLLNTPLAYDGAKLEYSTDGGSTWLQLGNYNDTTNWYNYSQVWSFGYSDGWSGNSSGWLTTGISMPYLVGESNVKFRFVFGSDDYNYATFEGFGFDDIKIFNDVDFIGDIGISNISSVIAGCEYSTGYDVIVMVKNYHPDSTYFAGEVVSLQYALNNGTPVIESFTLLNDLLPGDEVVYTFSTQLSLPVGGIYNLTASTLLIDDIDTGNDSFTVSVESYNSPIVDVLSITPAVCFNGLGTIDHATVSGYVYNWTGGLATEDISVPAGDYYVTITDSNGCVSSGGPFTVGQPAEMTLSLLGADNVCYNDAVGSVDLTVYNGQSPYTYLWSNNEVTQNISGLVGGTYSVTVTDALGCEAFGSVTLNQSGPFTAVININSPIACHNDANGELEVVATGGTQPYHYLWDNNSETTAIISGLGAGTYSVVVTDDNGCSAGGSTQVVDVPVFEEPANTGYDHTIVITSTTVITADGSPVIPGEFLIGVFYDNLGTEVCGGYIEWQGNVTAIAAKGFAPGEEFNWKMLRISDNALFDAVATYNPAMNGGFYVDFGMSEVLTLSGSFVPTGPVAAPLNATLINPAVLNVNLYSSNYNNFSISCFGGNNGELIAQGSGGVSPYTFVWSNSITGENIDNLTAGNYIVTMTDANSCTVTGQYEITQPTEFINTSVTSDLMCNGTGLGSIDITTSGGVLPYTYSWNTGATSHGITGLSGGNYSVVVTDNNGCSYNGSFSIYEPTVIEITESITEIVCNGSIGAISVSVSGGTPPYTYSWNGGGASDNLTNLGAGTYSLTVTDFNGCEAIETYTLVDPAPLSIDFTLSEPLCYGDLNGSIDITVIGGIAPFSYSWTGGSSSEDLMNVGVGTYSVNIIDGFGCTVSQTITLGQPDLLDGSLSVTDVSCNGSADGAIDLTVSGGFGAYSYLWSNGIIVQDLTGISGDTYSVTVTDENSCELVLNDVVKESQALPLMENFEAGVLPAGWELSQSAGSLGWLFGTSLGSTFWSVPAHTGYSATNDDGAVDPNNASMDYLITPLLDFTGYTSINLTFDAYVEETYLSTSTVEISTDGGLNWTVLSTLSSSANWQEDLVVSLDSYIGNCNVLIGFHYNDNGNWATGFAIDNVNIDGITQYDFDLSVTGFIIPPQDACNLTDNQPVTIEITNVGALDATNFSLTYTVDGTTSAPEAFVGTILAGATETFTFTVGADFLAVGQYICGANVIYPLDMDNSNDALTGVIVNHHPTINAFPYLEDFEDMLMADFGSDVGAQASQSILSDGGDYSLVVSGGDGLNGWFGGASATANDAWDLSVSHQVSSFTLCFVDATDLNSLELLLDLRQEFATNNTGSWFRVMVGNNQVGPDYTPVLPGEPYQTINLDLDTYAGTSFMLTLQFCNRSVLDMVFVDNIILREKLVDLEVTSITAPAVSCPYSNSESFDVTVENVGGLPVSSFNLDLIVNGDTTTNVVPGPLNSGGVLVYTFTGVDLTQIGNYTIVADVNAVDDVDAVNDTYSISLESAPDLSVTGVVPESVCEGVEFNVGLAVLNLSNSTIVAGTTVNAGYILNGVTVNESFVLGSDLASNGTATLNFVSSETYTNGTYSLDGFVNFVGDCNSTNDSFVSSIEIFTSPIANAGSDVSICIGNSITLTATGSDIYSWTGGVVQGQPFTPNVTETYIVTVEDSNGCFATDDVLVTVNALPVANAGTDVTVCAGDMVTLNATGNGTYLWSGGVVQGVPFMPTTSSTYTVTVTDGNLCEATDDVYVTVNELPNATASADPGSICNGESVVLTATGGDTYLWSTSANGASITVSPSSTQTYIVTVTNANNCVNTAQVTVNVTDGPVIDNFLITDNLCNGGTDGQIDISVSGGLPPYGYAWSNGATTEDLSGLVAGTYSVTVTDISGLGCANFGTYEVTDPYAIIVNVVETSGNVFYGISCNGENDGSALALPTNGTPPYTYEWNTGEVTAFISNLDAGSYTVTVTDYNGCEGISQITITEPDPLTVNLVSQSIDCNGAGNGSIIATPIGGTPPYIYFWNNGATTQNISNLQAGAYSVYIVDANGCFWLEAAFISEPSALVVNISSDILYNGFGVSCNGSQDGGITANISGGLLPYDIEWNTGAQTASLNYLAAGVYTITVTDANECVSISSITVTQPNPLLLQTLVTNVTCYGLSNGVINITPSYGVMPYTYIWSNGATTEDLNGVVAGTYTVTITDDNGCMLNSTRTITQPTELIISSAIVSEFGVFNIDCHQNNSGSISLTVSGGSTPYQYLWDDENGSTSSGISGLVAGVYTVTITDSHGCTLIQSYELTEPTQLEISNATLTHILCNGASTGEIDLSINGGAGSYSFIWSNSASTEDLSLLAAGSYTVTVTDINGCSITHQYTLTQPSAIVDNFVIINVDCYGNGNGSVVLNTSGGVLPYTFLWTNGSTDEDQYNLSGGTYSVVITDDNGCLFANDYTVAEPAELLISDVLVNVYCNGGNNGSIDLSISGGTSPYTYSWSGGQNTQDLSGLSVGTYYVTVTDAHGCEALGSYTISQPDALTASAVLSHPLCFGDMNGSIDVTVSGGILPYYFTWSNGAVSLDLTGLGAGVYTLTVYDGYYCTQVFTYELVQPDLLAFSAISSDNNGFSVSCNGGSNGAIDITVTGGTAPYITSWNNGSNTEDISGLTAGEYSVAISDANGCAISNNNIVLPWDYTITSSNHTILVSAAQLNGVALATGDYIGVFYDDNGVLECGGYVQWQNTTTGLTAFGDDSYSTDKDGFADNDVFIWKVWRAADGSVVDINADYNLGFANTNQYVTNGFSNVTLLSGTAPAVVPAGSGSWVLTEPDPIVIDYTVTNVTCYNGSDGVIDVTVSGGVAPYSYSWSTLEYTEDINGLSYGYYDVTVVDLNLCESTISILMDQPLNLVINDIITNVTCNGGENGSIDIEILEGTSPYTYVWSNGESTQDIFDLVIGTYDVLVTDYNGCTISGSYLVSESIAVEAAAIATSDYDGYSVSCFGSNDGTAEVSVISGGVAPFTYLWSDNSTNSIATGLGAGTHYVTVTDDNDCVAYASVLLTEPLALQAEAVVSSNYNGFDVSCNGSANGMVDLTVNVGFPPYTYLWSNGFTTQDLNGLAAGTYTVTITDSHLCTGTASVTIVDTPELEYAAVVSDAACNGGATGSIDLTVSGGTGSYLYFWSNGANTEDISNLAVGFYYVLVLDNNWCHLVSEVFEVSQPNELLTSISITSDFDGYAVSCLGATDGSVDLTVWGGTAPYSYTWSNGYYNEDLANVGAGTYSVTIVDYNGCMGYATVELTEPALFEISAFSTFDYNGYSVSCNGMLDGGVSVSIVNGFAPFSYEWDNQSTLEVLENVGAGTYYVTVTDNHGCIASSMVILNEADILSITGDILSDYNGYNVSCNEAIDGEIITMVSGGVGPFTYVWSNGETTSDISNAGAGIQEVTVTDLNGCSATNSFMLTFPETLAAEAILSSDYSGADISCNGMQNGSIDVTVTGGTGTGSYTYLWNTGDVTEDLTGLGAGTYSVTITDSNGCTVIAGTTLVDPQILDINVTALNSLCNGSNNGFAMATITGGTPPYMYFWSTSATTQAIGNLSPGMYYVFGLDANLCATNTYPIVISEPEELILETVVLSNNVCYGNTNGSIDLTISGGSTPYNVTWSNGAHTQDISNLAAGTYGVTVIDSHGCNKTTSVIITQPNQVMLSLALTHVNCNNQGSGAIDMTITNGVAPFTYIWSNGATTQDLTGLSGGFYLVTVTGALGCVNITGSVINEPTEIILTMTSQNQTCNGANNGSASVAVSGGSYPPYNYLWSSGQTTSGITGLSSGLYEVTVTDAHGCTEREEVFITEPDVISLSFTGEENLCNAGNGGSIDLTVSGGTMPYTYSWTGGLTTQDLTGLIAGTYYVTVYDFNGCSANGSYVITDAVPVNLTYTTVNINCFGDNVGEIDLTISGGVSPYSIMWSGFAQQGTFDWTYNNTGSNHTILIPNTIGINIGGMAISNGDYLGVFYDNNGVLECGGYVEWNGNSLALTAWGSEAGMMNGFANNEVFTWKVWRAADGIEMDAQVTYETIGFPNTDLYATNGISAISSLVSGMAEDLSGLTAGTYVVTVTDAVGCTGVASIVVTQPNVITTPFTVVNVTCNGAANGSINLSVFGGVAPYTYLWSNGQTVQDISNLTPGVYSVTVTDSHQCTKTTSVTITEPAILDFNWSTTDVLCSGDNSGTATLNITGGTAPYNVNWGGAVPSALYAGTYNVIVTDAKGCSVNHEVNIYQPLSISASFNNNMVSCNGLMDGNIDVTVSGGTLPYNYLWNGNITSEDLLLVGAGDYELVITDGNGCTYTEMITVTQPEELSLSGVTADLVCFGTPIGSIDLTAVGGTEPYQYSWSNNEISEDISNLYAGTYEVVVTDANDCTSSISFEINEPLELVVSYLTTNVTCYNGSDGAIDVSVVGGVSPYSYSWLTGESIEDLSGLEAGIYTIVVTDNNYCEVTTEIVVEQPLQIELVFGITNVSCYGLSDGVIDMTIVNGVAPFSISWSNNSMDEDLSGLAAGSYEVVVTDYNGCSATGMVEVTQPEELGFTSTTSNVSCFEAGDGYIDIEITGGTQPYNVEWGSAGTGSFNWDYVNTGTNHTIIIPLSTPIDLNGTPIANGDYIGLFYDSLGTSVCAGYVQWNGINTNIAAWGTETDLITGATLNDGYAIGELLKWKIWQASTGIIYDAQPTYLIGALDNAYYVTDGMSSLLSLSGSITYDYTSNTVDMFNAGIGAYQVVITDANGCMTSGEFILTQPDQIVVESTISSFNGFGVSSCGGNDGSISINITGGMAPYSFAWSNGATTEDISSLTADTYGLTVTDASGCNAYGEYVVTEFCNPIIIDCVASNVTCYLASNGSVNLTVSGGLLPYSILWSNGNTTEDLSGLTAGTYSVTVIDAYGQMETCSSVVVAPSAMTFTSIISNVTTYGGTDGAIDITVNGGTPPYAYAWTNGVTSQDNSNLAAGWYGCLVTDANNCQIGFNLQVTQPIATPLSIVSVVASNVSCSGATNGSVNLTIGDGVAPFVFAWSNGSSSEDLNNVGAGIYSVTVTDFVGTMVIGSAEVIEPATTMTFTSYTTDAWSCLSNGSADITVADGASPYTYMWNTGSTTEDLMDVAAGIYSVIVTDNNGCSMTISDIMVNADLLSVNVVTTDNVCYGESTATALALINGGAIPYSFEWSNGQTVDYIIGLTAGTYTVTVTDFFGCDIVQTMSIVDPDEIVVQIVTNPIGITANVVSGAVGAVTYLWSNGKPYQSIKGLTSGVEYCVTVTDSNGCTGTACYLYTGSSVISFGGNGFSTNAKEVENDLFANSDLNINVYPNPSKDGKLFIEFDNVLESIQFEIIDAYGRSIYNQKLDNSIDNKIYVDLGNVNSGVYYLRIFTENYGVITKRIAIVD